MTVYWFVWVGVLLLSYLVTQYDYEFSPALVSERQFHTKSAKGLFVLASLVLIFVAGLRFEVGDDFYGYYNYRKYQDPWNALKTFQEPGIRFVYWLAVKIRETNQFCIFAVAAVTLGLELAFVYRNTSQLGLALALFLFTCWTACFNGVRQALATAVLLCGYPYLRDRKFWKYLIIVILAFLCHRSAIVMILAYFIVDREANPRNIILLVIAAVVVLYFYDYVFKFMSVVLDDNVTGTEAYLSTKVNRLRTASKVAPAIFFLIVYWKEEKTPLVSFYLNLLVLHAVVAVTTTNSACLARMSMYTDPFAILAIAELVKIFPKKSRRWISAGIIALYWFMEWFEIQGKESLNHFRLHWF